MHCIVLEGGRNTLHCIGGRLNCIGERDVKYFALYRREVETHCIVLELGRNTLHCIGGRSNCIGEREVKYKWSSG